jgi:MFS family permease
MKPFLEAFFPKVLRRMADAKRNQYCMFDSHALTSFTSSLYLAGLVASLAAGRVTRSLGRRGTMLAGGALFFAGGAMTGGAANLAMLIAGRMLLGFGVGFTNQATPLYLAEMAPARWRGSLTLGFQFFVSLGILIANLVNYGTARLTWGWRLSLGLAGAPALIMFVGAFFLTDTPSSFVMRGKEDLARAALVRVRGPSADVEAELRDIARAVEAARGREEGAFRRLFAVREYRPHLTFAFVLPLCHQLSGMMVLTFFSPLVFRIAGFGSNAALMGAVILASVKFGSLILSTLVIDRYGRKALVIAGAVIMVVCQVSIHSTRQHPMDGCKVRKIKRALLDRLWLCRWRTRGSWGRKAGRAARPRCHGRTGWRCWC